ncbi:MAG: hypothetical protein U0350_03460 [Caldilineaceae bacterium]
MIQEITISGETSVLLKPLVESAIRSQLKSLTHGIGRTRERLKNFEQKYNMSSAEFERRFKTHAINESLDFIDWWMEVEALYLLESKYQALHEARIG